ncbi:HK97 gp10 family phage protein [Lactobacillus sp. PV034]|uniref:HK97 gp10 family phage protein n=1 Tax=Lactobacillus sp. PV034 TaxID=2594495 RepID=UPI00224075FC|nr:HK97 gp10 family phage protein [Lactobacillus sp. PV034]QNQ80785.1 HK97 gp10 family phage protein [Lactobacillus sp. PV034]
MSLGEVDDAQFQEFAKKVEGQINSGGLKQKISKSTKRIGEQSLRILKSNTPVDEGNLRRSWTADGPGFGAGGWTIRLTNNAEYASFVELGHRQTPGRYVPAIHKRLKASWVAGHFFMHKSMGQIEGQIPRLLDPEVAKVMRDLFDD